MGNMRTFILMAAMTALLMGLGWLLGGQGGAIMALVFAGAGNGTLSLRGQSYPFRLAGTVVGPGGAARIQASGHVYGLNRIEDLNRIMSVSPGCSRFLISKPLKNPFLNWCDEGCDTKCPERYDKALNQLIASFFIANTEDQMTLPIH